MQMDPIRRGGVVLSVRLWRAVKLEVEDRTLQPGARLPGAVTAKWTQVRTGKKGKEEEEEEDGGDGGRTLMISLNCVAGRGKKTERKKKKPKTQRGDDGGRRSVKRIT